MNMPIFLDNNKDKLLIEWLGSKTNRSATVREVLYSYLSKITPPESFAEDDEDDEDFIDSLNNF